MTTTVFLSNNVIQVAVGSKGRNANGIQKVKQLEMSEGSLINGMITNEADLTKNLAEFWAQERFPKTDVELVVNALSFSVKKMEIPNLSIEKQLEMIALEYGNNEDGEQEIFDFIPITEKPKGQLREIVSVRATEAQILKWQEIFQSFGVTLSSITASNIAIYKYIKSLKEIDSKVCIILGIDDNSFYNVLWTNGHQNHAQSKRFFSLKGTSEFGIEAARQISEIQQFYRSLKLDIPLTEIYLYGFSKEDADTLSENLMQAGMGMEVFALPGKFADYIGAAGNFVQRKEDINLLDALKKKRKREKQKKLPIKYFVIPVITLLVCAVIIGILMGYSISLNKEIKGLQDYCDDPVNRKISDEVIELRQDVAYKQSLLNQVEQVDTMEASYPEISSRVIAKVLSAAQPGIQAQVTDYQAKTGILSLSATVAEVDECNRYIENLRKTGLFLDVDYTGYQYNNQTNLYDVYVQGILISGIE